VRSLNSNTNLAHIIEEDLPGEYDLLVAEIGIEKTLKVAKMFGGSRVYFHKYDTVEKPLRNRKIREEFNGYNYSELARKYNLTEVWIREICEDIVEKKRGKSIEGQINIFDCQST